MSDFLTSPFAGGPSVSPSIVGIRLVAALILGWLVAWIYRRARHGNDPASVLEVSYERRLAPQRTADEMVKALNQIDGVQRVQLQRRGFEMD